MSGGIAYILDENRDFGSRCNMGMVELESVEETQDIDELRSLVEKHAQYTGSTVATSLLANWQQALTRFVKVMPTDYKRALAEQQAGTDASIEPEAKQAVG